MIKPVSRKQTQLWLVLSLVVPLFVGVLFGGLQLGAAAALPLEVSLIAWVGFAYIYWAAFEMCGHGVAWLLRPVRAPLVLVLIVAVVVGKIIGRPVMIEYAGLFSGYLTERAAVTLKPYSQFGITDLGNHLRGNLPLMLAWICASLYFHKVLGLTRFGYLSERGTDDAAPVVEPSAQQGATGIVALARTIPEEVAALSAEDHYVRVHLRNGYNQMILYRFATALSEFAREDGLQVHRSHWVRRNAVEHGVELGRAGRLTMAGGAEIPVSHAYLALVRQHGLLTRQLPENRASPQSAVA
jgi:LytTr DNA-binding domain